MNKPLSVFHSLWKLLESMVYHVLRFFFRLIGKELTDPFFASFMQFVKFGLVGVTNALVNYVVYLLTLFFLRAVGWAPRIDNYIALAVAYIVSVLWSFLWNNTLVFKKEEGRERNLLAALLKCYATYFFTGVVLNQFLLYLWLNVFHVSEFIAPILNSIICIPINFLMNKFWAFRDRRSQ